MSGLKENQYINSSNYNARILLHYRFSSNKYSWPLWIFDSIMKIEKAKVLEIGCGNGLLWKLNNERIPETWEVTLTDFSEGMLKDAELNIGNTPAEIKYQVMDAENIPFEDNSFNIVLANHMLYHLQDRKKVFSEIRRVLKGGGFFYATTMDGEYMKELTDIIREYRSLPARGIKSNSVIQNFSLQNGMEQLEEYFSEIKMDIYENFLKITEAAPLADYAVSLNNITAGRIVLKEEERESFISFVRERINRDRGIIIHANAGIFTSRLND